MEALDLITETPSYIGFSNMRDYQIDGLKWLVDKYMRGLRGMILADEMGLGKVGWLGLCLFFHALFNLCNFNFNLIRSHPLSLPLFNSVDFILI